MATTDKLKVTNLFSVHDHVCLVTGGGTGIGLMAAQALASNGTKNKTVSFFAIVHYCRT